MNRGVSPHLRPLSAQFILQNKYFLLAVYLLILEFNICMKQKTEIPSNLRGEFTELLFTFTVTTYFVHLVHLVGKK